MIGLFPLRLVKGILFLSRDLCISSAGLFYEAFFKFVMTNDHK